jgi:hypothetical protein
MKTLVLIAACAAAGAAGCSASQGYEGAFSDKEQIPGNSHTFQAGTEPTFRAVTSTLVQKGFTIDMIDASMGLVKATRNYTDPKKPEINYHITAMAHTSPAPAVQGTVVTLSASQQTVLYKKGHNWSALPIVPLPIPTGRKHETVTTGEGSIVSASFYADFFSAVDSTLAGPAAPGIAHAAAALPASSPPEPTASQR